MKDLGRSANNNGYIVELTENEHQSLRKLINLCGEDGEYFYTGVTYPTPEMDITGWTDAIYVWMTNKHHIATIRDGAIKMLETLTGKGEG